MRSRNRGQHAWPRARETDAGDRGAELAPDPHLQTSTASPSRRRSRTSSRRSAAWRMLFSAIRLRSQRGGDQARAPLTVTARGVDQSRHRRHGQGLPRQNARDALGHRQSQSPAGIPSLWSGLRARPGFNDIESVRQAASRTTRASSRCWSSPSRAKADQYLHDASTLRDLREALRPPRDGS